ncbi:MAG: hypothetical protein KIS67_13290 [Verrucomicrobiae bacterium]|nr:hypothetical protein [Verrucomicrobiae bacterium]
MPKENGREEAGAWRRLLFSKRVLCAEQTTTKNQRCRPKESHLIFCGQWFEDGVHLMPLSSIAYAEDVEFCQHRDTNNNNYCDGGYLPKPHLTNAVDVAGYVSWGFHSTLGIAFSTNGTVTWTGASSWWLIESFESGNGQRNTDYGGFFHWFAPNAFGGANHANTPVGAVTHVDEPGLSGVNNPYTYFNLWASGKSFGIAAWNSRRTERFQAVGDPFVVK